jgi:hypothetical protein
MGDQRDFRLEIEWNDERNDEWNDGQNDEWNDEWSDEWPIDEWTKDKWKSGQKANRKKAKEEQQADKRKKEKNSRIGKLRRSWQMMNRIKKKTICAPRKNHGPAQPIGVWG